MHMRLPRVVAVTSFLLGLSISPLAFGDMNAKAEITSETPCSVAQTVPPSEAPTVTAPTNEALPDAPDPIPGHELPRSPVRFSEAFPDPLGDDTTQEFIEIENPDGREQDIAGWVIADDDGRSFVLDIRVGPGAQYAFLYAESKLHLVNSGMTLTLRDPSGTIMDTLTYSGPAKTGKAFARTSDGTWKWTSLTTPGRMNEFDPETSAPPPPPPAEQAPPVTETELPATPLATETPVTSASPGPEPRVSIVAFLPDPVGDDNAEWITLANDGPSEALLSGWSIDDKEGGSKPYPLASLTVPAKGRVVIPRSDSKIILNNDSDEVRLLGPDGLARLTVPYTDPPEGRTYELLEGVWTWMPSADGVATGVVEEQATATDGASPVETATEEPVAPLDISDIETSDDELVEISGMVTIPPGVVGKRTFAVQAHDGTAGVFVRAYGRSAMPPLAAGDTVRIIGRAANGAFSTLGQRVTRVAAGTVRFHERAIDEIEEKDGGVAVAVAGIVTHRGRTSLVVSDDAMRRELTVRTGKYGKASGVTVGAPPDAFFTTGQNWAFPPCRPESMRRQGYRYFIDSVRHQLTVAGLLRIDHVFTIVLLVASVGVFALFGALYTSWKVRRNFRAEFPEYAQQLDDSSDRYG